MKDITSAKSDNPLLLAAMLEERLYLETQLAILSKPDVREQTTEAALTTLHQLKQYALQRAARAAVDNHGALYFAQLELTEEILLILKCDAEPTAEEKAAQVARLKLRLSICEILAETKRTAYARKLGTFQTNTQRQANSIKKQAAEVIEKMQAGQQSTTEIAGALQNRFGMSESYAYRLLKQQIRKSTDQP